MSSDTTSTGGVRDPDRPTPSGLIADRYVLGEIVGRGGSAWVYRALDQVLERQVAVKVFPPGVSGPERSRQQRELTTLSQLHHPNLVELFDAGESDGQAFLVMRLVDGPTLADRLLEEPLPVATAAELGAGLSDALAHVHAAGITHRDIKPANVLLGPQPMLADFGIAQLIDATRLTATGSMIGTVAYMAPEQVRGEPVGPPADVYALGLVVLEAVTGVREYTGNVAEAAMARLTRPPHIPEHLPVGLGPVLERMTGGRPEDRPTAAVAAHELHRVAVELHDGPPGAPASLPTHQRTRASGTPAPRSGPASSPPSGPASSPPSGPASSPPSGPARASRRRAPLLVFLALAAALALAAFGAIQLTSAVAPPVATVPAPEPAAATAPSTAGPAASSSPGTTAGAAGAASSTGGAATGTGSSVAGDGTGSSGGSGSGAGAGNSGGTGSGAGAGNGGGTGNGGGSGNGGGAGDGGGAGNGGASGGGGSGTTGGTSPGRSGGGSAAATTSDAGRSAAPAAPKKNEDKAEDKAKDDGG